MQKTAKKQYIRVGTKYYLIAQKPLASGDSITKLIEWSKSTIREDETDKDILKKIPKYIDFVCVPGHLDYQQTVGEYYNLYEPFNHKPDAGDCNTSLQFVRHIFGEHYELGLDYLKLLLENPVQKLPVLSLVSRQRNTGKTTFLNWLKAIYQGNMSICRSADFASNFNSEWVNKRIVAIDETFLEKKPTSETLKALSTAHNIVKEAKGKDREQVPFNGVIVLCTNNETDFVRIDDEETRYWVRKVQPMEQDDPNFLDKLKAEIPAFLYYLTAWKLTTEKQGRMWFTQSQIWTEALERLKAESRHTLEKELEIIVTEKLQTFGLEEIQFDEQDLIELLKTESNIRCTRGQVSKLLREKWGLESKNSSYKYYYLTIAQDGEWLLSHRKEIGAFYSFSRSFFEKLKNRNA